MICDEDQEFKVNYAMFHGVCRVHLTSQDKNVCKICRSNVNCLGVFPLKTCGKCEKWTVVKENTCGHAMCSPCCKLSECQICRESPVAKPNKAKFVDKGKVNHCEFCLDGINSLKRSCAHALCEDCNEEKCKVCMVVNNVPEIIKNELCDFCLMSKMEAKKRCGHGFCMDCDKEICSICNDVGKVTDLEDEGSNVSQIGPEDEAGLFENEAEFNENPSISERKQSLSSEELDSCKSESGFNFHEEKISENLSGSDFQVLEGHSPTPIADPEDSKFIETDLKDHKLQEELEKKQLLGEYMDFPESSDPSELPELQGPDAIATARCCVLI